MTLFGVRCTMADGEDMLITVEAATADGALSEVRAHQRMFGLGDTAGNWLASTRPKSRTITRIHDDVSEVEA